MNVPFYKPSLPAYDLVESDFRKAYESGMLAPSVFTDRFKKAVEEHLGVKHAVMFSNCSDAMMCLVGYIGRLTQKKRVIIPNFTFASTWQAVDWNGMTAVLVDTDDRGLMDPQSVESALLRSGPVACILAVHMFGEPAYVEELQELALQYGTTVIYDSAHGLGSLYKDKPLGGWGMAEVFSIGTTKPLSAGEGGILTTNDDQLAEAMHRAAMHGHKYGELDVEVRSLNGRIQEINSIMGYHALQKLEEETVKRCNAASYYHGRLAHFAPDLTTLLPRPGVRSTYKDFAVRIPTYRE
ncbi:MAG: DegT/DnrJ/EryC1/StrS family aminotransferase, partial [Candidatus Thorarchaeota archaeon]